MPESAAKYQFNIYEYNEKTRNSAASKAVMDCNELFSRKGYSNKALSFNNNSKRGLRFYSTVFFAICKFLLKVEKGALVGIQYPMLNNIFKYFIVMSQLKNIKYFCIVHDIESLRLGGTDSAEVAIELRNLNYYDSIIVHNDIMKQWLKNNGINKKMISLGIFDYLTDSKPLTTGTHSNRIVYAGNLGKSGFVNALKDINKWSFELYGPNYHQQEFSPNVAWRGEFSPAQIVNEINGDFGLIWDGERVDIMDNILGHYLRFNNPHKFSLYIAAGLPVIVPKEAAVATFVKHHNIGILIDSLYDLQTIVINDEAYAILKKNVVHLQTKVTRGDYFLDALGSVENQLSN